MNRLDAVLVALAVVAALVYVVRQTVRTIRGRAGASCCGDGGSAKVASGCSDQVSGGCAGCRFSAGCTSHSSDDSTKASR